MKLKYLGHAHTTSYYSIECPSRLYKGDELSGLSKEAAARLLSHHPEAFEALDAEAKAVAKEVGIIAAAPQGPAVKRAPKGPSQRRG